MFKDVNLSRFPFIVQYNVTRSKSFFIAPIQSLKRIKYLLFHVKYLYYPPIKHHGLPICIEDEQVKA